MFAPTASAAVAERPSETARQSPAIESLRDLARSDQRALKSVRAYDALPEDEKSRIADYLDSPQFSADVVAVADGKSVDGRLIVKSNDSVQSSQVTRAPASAAAAKIWQVSREHQIDVNIPGTSIGVYSFWHRLHYNHNGAKVVGTRSCEGDVTGWTGAWTIEKNDARSSHYASGGIGHCDTTWKWKAAGQGNWAYLSESYWTVNYKAQVTSSKITPMHK